MTRWNGGRVKADLVDKLRVNAAAFASRYEDMQLIFRQGVVPLLFNAGSALIDGVEVEFTYASTVSLGRFKKACGRVMVTRYSRST